MTWEETIKHIRTQPEFESLVLQAYFHEDLRLNVQNYIQSAEFIEVLQIIKTYAPNAKNILDIGCGNGITSIGFALEGYTVDAVEPDTSDTVGANAIKKAAELFDVSSLITVHTSYAEEIHFPDNHFDIVFARQAMHHAHHLEDFVAEMARTLKKGGLFFTIRDHVIFNEKDKQRFLQEHPLQKFYGGENAFTPKEYKSAISKAGLTLQKELCYFESIINYFPFTLYDFSEKKQNEDIKKELKKKIGFIANFSIIINLYKYIKNIRPISEVDISGRMYSYIATK